MSYRQKKCQASSLVGFVLSIPLLVLFLLGIIDLIFTLMHQIKFQSITTNIVGALSRDRSAIPNQLRIEAEEQFEIFFLEGVSVNLDFYTLPLGVQLNEFESIKEVQVLILRSSSEIDSKIWPMKFRLYGYGRVSRVVSAG